MDVELCLQNLGLDCIFDIFKSRMDSGRGLERGGLGAQNEQNEEQRALSNRRNTWAIF